MSEIKKNFGFGMMRLPMTGDKVDLNQTSQMVDCFIAQGFNYFDTAHGYINGQSEVAVKECLTSRYPRDSYILTNKLTNTFFKHEGGIRPLFNEQLKACGVDYFDYYLMHAQNKDVFEKYKRCRAYETSFELKKEGKVRNVGISFHSDAETLDKILTEYPELDVVQLQFNYLDYENSYVQSKACYDVCCKHGKPVIVMEPVRGGMLVNLPEEAQKKVNSSGLGNAELAIRFAASFPNIKMVLSGMSSLEQMEQNTSFMKDFVPLTDKEFKICSEVAAIIKGRQYVPCTGCQYCMANCPKQIKISEIFKCINATKDNTGGSAAHYYNFVHTREGSKASDCIKCGQCEKACPQGLKIRDLLEEAKNLFEVPLEKH